MKGIKKNLFIQDLTDSSLPVYFKEINRYKRLTHQEELELGGRILMGDMKAVNKLVLGNLKFVVWQAKKCQDRGLPLADLINEGNLGLLAAAKKFNVSLGCKFITYAVWDIKQSISQALRKAPMVKVPDRKLHIRSLINKGISDLEQRLNRNPSTSEISNLLNLDEEQVIDCFKYDSGVVSIDNAKFSYINDTLADPDSGIDHDMNVKAKHIDLLRLIDTLDKREAMIIKHFYGVGLELKTLAEIALLMNLSKERVRQLKDGGMKKLKRRGPRDLGNLGTYGA